MATTTAIRNGEPGPSFPEAPSVNPSVATRTEKDLIRQQKDRFRLFIRVLLTYLKSKDPELQLQVRAIIKDCKAKHVKKIKGYESVTAAMRRRIKLVVGEGNWRRAEQHFVRYQEQHRC